MKIKPLHIGQKVAVRGNLYSVDMIKTYGPGLMFRCYTYKLNPENPKLPRLSATQWQDGEIFRLKKSV